ncbi:S8 family peptidase [Jejudonia soesokkakensis]|uniref:S8 family peptidase n=1 Tax=Jejudonia soesokkakensis TaxID=1323432 RepID=A0ABW2MXD7_9FLAO
MKRVLLGFIFFISVPVVAQEDALVYFADKENVAESLANPISILTQAAIDRKEMHGTPIDERDVPVTEDYIIQIEASGGIEVFAKSKWLNAVYVIGTQSNISNLLSLDFVTDIEYMDKSLNAPRPALEDAQDKFEFETSASRIIYDYGAATNQVEMLAVDFLHEEDFTGEGIPIAVMDSGFPNVFSNPAFSAAVTENRIIDTYDFVRNETGIDGNGSHGARTFSDIAGLLDGQFVGTAPQSTYYLYVTEDSRSGMESPVEEAYWLEALERADSLGVFVTNTSLGYQDFEDSRYDHSYEDLDGQTTIGARAANISFEKGMLSVTSAGNDGGGFTFVGTPGDAIGIYTVGAVDANENFASFSSIGPTVDGRIKPDGMAQGRDAAVVDENGNVTINNGTSFSSPIMAGAIASLWQSRPQTTNGQIMQLVREASSLFTNPTDEMGYGIPDFQEAYNALQALAIDEYLLRENFALYPNPFSTEVNFSFPENISKASVEIYNVLGEKILEKEISSVNNRIDTSAITSGVYIAKISSEGKSNSFKIVKQ